MKIKLLDWATPVPQPEEGGASDYLLKMGYVGLDYAALDLSARLHKPIGLVPPYDLDNRAYTFRCMAMVRDHFSPYVVYAPVPKWCSREAIRAARGTGFGHFILPFFDPWAFVHQTVHDLLADAKGVHVAGGDPKIEGWTWSEEQL